MRLEGPLQSWATQSKLSVRDTDREPSKSGVLGLVGAALGMERDDDAMLAELAACALAVRVDRPGTLLRDFHTAGGSRFRGREHFVYGVSYCVPTDRYYLQGASFVAALTAHDALADRIAGALASPRWPLYLGRRACPPSEPVLMDVVAAGAPEAARAPSVASGAAPGPLRLLVESAPELGGEPRYDVPFSFRAGAKRYGIRYVRTEWVERGGEAMHAS